MAGARAEAEADMHLRPTIGCTQALMRKTGGDGLIYCFAAN